MIRLCVASRGQVIPRGGIAYRTESETFQTTSMTSLRMVMVMCTTATRQMSFRELMARAQMERYRRYAEAKRKIPMDLPSKEYEARVKRLIKKYKI